MTVAIYGVLGFAVAVVVTYVLVRAASVAYFRARAEYDRGALGKLLRGDDNAKR